MSEPEANESAPVGGIASLNTVDEPVELTLPMRSSIRSETSSSPSPNEETLTPVMRTFPSEATVQSPVTLFPPMETKYLAFDPESSAEDLAVSTRDDWLAALTKLPPLSETSVGAAGGTVSLVNDRTEVHAPTFPSESVARTLQKYVPSSSDATDAPVEATPSARIGESIQESVATSKR